MAKQSTSVAPASTAVRQLTEVLCTLGVEVMVHSVCVAHRLGVGVTGIMVLQTLAHHDELLTTEEIAVLTREDEDRITPILATLERRDHVACVIGADTVERWRIGEDTLARIREGFLMTEDMVDTVSDTFTDDELATVSSVLSHISVQPHADHVDSSLKVVL